MKYKSHVPNAFCINQPLFVVNTGKLLGWLSSLESGWRSRMLRIVAGVFLALHGLVHLLWFGVTWRFITPEGLPYSTKVLADRINVGEGGIRLAGLLWLAATVIWVTAGIGLVFSAPWWHVVTVAAALFSSVMCILGLPVAKYGLLINLVILVLLFLNGQFRWVA